MIATRLPVRALALALALAVATAVGAVHYATPLLGWLGWFHDVLYNGVLLGSAALCVAAACFAGPSGWPGR